MIRHILSEPAQLPSEPSSPVHEEKLTGVLYPNKKEFLPELSFNSWDYFFMFISLVFCDLYQSKNISCSCTKTCCHPGFFVFLLFKWQDSFLFLNSSCLTQAVFGQACGRSFLPTGTQPAFLKVSFMRMSKGWAVM